MAIQHPGEARGSTFETPSTRWPDFKTAHRPDLPCRHHQEGWWADRIVSDVIEMNMIVT